MKSDRPLSARSIFFLAISELPLVFFLDPVEDLSLDLERQLSKCVGPLHERDHQLGRGRERDVAGRRW